MASPHHLPITIQMLLDRVDRCPESGCWIWKRCRNACGYGTLAVHGKHWLAPRFYFHFFRRYPLQDLQVLHVYDNPPCCNPWHLFLGTVQDNMADSTAKQRRPWGERNARAILTNAQVVEIRLGNESAVSLAAKYGMRASSMRKILRGEKYKYLPFARRKYERLDLRRKAITPSQ